MCWPLCRPCQKNANPLFQMDSKSHTHTHTHLRLKLSWSIILCFAWRQRLGSQIEVVPEVPSGIASSYVCSLDSAKPTGSGHAPMFGAILSPHRQLQIAHMARVSESMPLSTEEGRETILC